MDNELIDVKQMESEKPPIIRPHFMVLPKKDSIDGMVLKEVKTETIPVQAAQAMNEPQISLLEDREENIILKEKKEEIEQLEMVPNGFSGMYFLIGALMLAMIGISILGILLS